MKNKTEDEIWERLRTEHGPGYTGSPVAPLSHRTENDRPVKFDVSEYQIGVFRSTRNGKALFEFLEDYEKGGPVNG